MTKKIDSVDSSIIAQQYKNAVDIANIVTKTDPKGRITYANEKFLSISGYSHQELIGKPHNIVNHPDMDKKVFQNLWKTIKNKNIWKGTLKNRAKDGSTYIVTATIIPILDRSNEIVEYIAIRQDISDFLKQRDIIKNQTTDYLTKLPNREKLLTRLESVKNPNIGIIKISNFKEINELFGFEISDQVLIDISKKILYFLKDSKARVYKLPSDEFAILLDEKINITLFKELI